MRLESSLPTWWVREGLRYVCGDWRWGGDGFGGFRRETVGLRYVLGDWSYVLGDLRYVLGI